MIDLTKEQKIAIRLLSESNLKDKFYWTGGTLLANYYFHHRYSYDLDFFSNEEIKFDEVNALAQVIKKKGGFQSLSFQRIYDRFEFLFNNKKNLRIEFVFYNHEKKTLKERKEYLGVFIDSLEDIAANKYIALVDRNEPKDLFDLFYIFTKGRITPQKLIKLAEKKFGVLIPEDQLWSRAILITPELWRIKPLVVGDEAEKADLLKKIEFYFKEKSREYLNRQFSL